MSAVYDVVDETTNTSCLLEVISSDAIAVDDIGSPSEIASRMGGLVGSEQNVKIFEPGIDQQTGRPYFVLEQVPGPLPGTNPDEHGELSVDKPVEVVKIAPVKIPLPPAVPPPLTAKPLLPLPPPLMAAKPLLPVPPPLVAKPLPPPNPPPIRSSLPGLLPPVNPPLIGLPIPNGDVTRGGAYPLHSARASYASQPLDDDLMATQLMGPSVPAASSHELPTTRPLPMLFGQRRSIGVAIVLGIGIVAISVVILLMRQNQDESQPSADVVDQAPEGHSLRTASPLKAQTNPAQSPDPALPSTADHVESASTSTETAETPRATPKTSTKTTEKAARGPAQISPSRRKTKKARESLY